MIRRSVVHFVTYFGIALAALTVWRLIQNALDRHYKAARCSVACLPHPGKLESDTDRCMCETNLEYKDP